MGLELNVSAVIPLCENMPSGGAVKPGDVIFTRSGLSVEIDNTDAEGRLILADAIHYASSTFKPKVLIDIATLTGTFGLNFNCQGAMDVALGFEFTGLFSNSDALVQKLLDAGRVEGDPFWRMPVVASHLDTIKSHVADLKNNGNRRFL